MQRASGRASPTPTTFSGISNYKTDSYRPIGGGNGAGNPPSVPALDSRTIARIHYEELSKYLAAYLAKAPANSRASARQKLTRLTKQQFQELSTDVYDELVRRKKNTTDNDVPFLPVRADFHPKRNQARQKLATLPSSRFEDLSSDVYYELVRRYPDFKEEGLTPTDTPISPNSTYDDVPSPEFPNPNSPPQPQSSLSSGPSVRRHTVRDSEDRGVDSGYGGSPYGRKSVDDRDYAASSGRRSNDVYSSGRRSNDLYSSRMSEDSSSGGGLAYSSSIASRRRPSQDTTRRSGPGGEDSSSSELYRRPSVSDSVSTGTTAHSATAMSSVVIPNKSTMAEEEIEVPYGRDTRDSQSTAMDERERERDRSRSRGDLDSFSDLEPSPLGMGGLSGLRDRLKNAEDEDESERGPAAGSAGADRSGDEYFERLSYGHTSVQSDRSGGGGAGPRNGRASTVTTEEQEKMRREYEYKIATMQSRITSLERDLDSAEDQKSKWIEGEDRVQMMDEELRELRKRAEEESNTVRNLRRELDELREQRAREKENEARRAQADEEELVILRERCERLEEERQNGGSVGGPDPEIIEQLRSDMQGLLTELSELSHRNDELMTAKDSDLVVIRDLDQQMKEYKRKYEQAKTELRNLKATSQLFLQAPKQQIEDQLPFSPDGGVLDIHVTAFVSAIDSLLTAGRSNAPTRVLAPMKSIVNAVHAIIEDVRFYERRNSNADVEHLRSLRERADATLSNLMAAAKSHAQSSGMAPVSLLDAAASHVSVTMTEIGKTVSVRKATKAEQEQFAATSPPLPPAPVRMSYSPSLRTVEEMRSSGTAAAGSSSRSASGSVSSIRRIDNNSPVTQARVLESPAAAARSSPVSRLSLEERRQPPSGPSSSNGSSPPPIFDQSQGDRGVGSASEESAAPEGNEDAWAELKPYLEAQTEAIVYDIQAVLAGVRAPAPPSQLNENVTQIITIVSSIVAVCNGNFPPASAAEGMEIVGQLSEHANKLSEVQAQAQADLTKETRQTMAKSSFAIANAMKALMKL